ncbi:MAG TPA: hypothetical protein VEK06_04650, partial [Myxococcota bacterium]|nr:hypothetical protein [Myxococcota bacterium]
MSRESQSVNVSQNVTTLPLTPFSAEQSALSAFFALQGWQDLGPLMRAADQAEQEKQLALRQAFLAYQTEASVAPGKTLLQLLRQEQTQWEAEKEDAIKEEALYQAQAKQAIEARSGYGPSSFYQWVSHGVHDFFGSSEEALAEKYAKVAMQRKQQLAQLREGIKVLEEELAAIAARELEDSQADRLEDDIKPDAHLFASRHLLQSGSSLSIARSVPDQTIQIGQPWSYSLEGVFSGGHAFVLTA